MKFSNQSDIRSAYFKHELSSVTHPISQCLRTQGSFEQVGRVNATKQHERKKRVAEKIFLLDI
jgi:hypothetical protein